MVAIVVKYGHCVCPIFLNLWDIYLLTLEEAGLECDTQHVIFRFSFPNCTQRFLIVPILFPGEIFQGMYYRVGGVSSLTDQDWNEGGVFSYVIP